MKHNISPSIPSHPFDFEIQIIVFYIKQNQKSREINAFK